MKKLKDYIPIALIIPLLMLCLVVSSCSDDGLLPESAVKIYPETFSFLDVGINTLYSTKLRHRLGSILDDDSIQKNNTIDLGINTESFINDYFPEFDAINLKLNTPTGERVEHKSIKLMYRYAKNKGLPLIMLNFCFPSTP